MFCNNMKCCYVRRGMDTMAIISRDKNMCFGKINNGTESTLLGWEHLALVQRPVP